MPLVEHLGLDPADLKQLGLGSQVVIGVMLCRVLQQQAAIKRHILGCPTCRKSRVPLSYLLTALAIIGASLLTGCKVTTIKGELHGKPFAFRDSRFFMNSGAEFELPTTNGPVRFKVSSSPNAEALGAVAEGAARGVASGLKKAALP